MNGSSKVKRICAAAGVPSKVVRGTAGTLVEGVFGITLIELRADSALRQFLLRDIDRKAGI